MGYWEGMRIVSWPLPMLIPLLSAAEVRMIHDDVIETVTTMVANGPVQLHGEVVFARATKCPTSSGDSH